ncbi:MAG: hypothetical protein Q7U74_15290 [Saprospiraceae bacterium]|nr:hypothetical protein [Saprospiraceae bacterium]
MKQIAIRYGVWLFFGLTGFFLLMHLFQLSERFYLRIFNGAIHLGILWLALRAWIRDHHDGAADITSGVAVGMFTSSIGVIPFTLFMATFLEFNPDILSAIKGHASMGAYLTPITACFFIVVEAIVISLIGSYIMLRILSNMREEAQADRS